MAPQLTPPIPDPGEHPPVAVWDAHEAYWPRGPYYQRGKWVDENLGGAAYTFRVEFYLIDVPFAVVYRYRIDDNGRFLCRGHCVEESKPEIYLLAALPPEDIL